MLRQFILLSMLGFSFSAYSTAKDPYADLKFYYGDNHFHSGFSGDNVDDAHPLAALINAMHQAIQYGKDAVSGGDPTDELGGYFLFMSDHIKFAPTRRDMTDEYYQVMRHEVNDPALELQGVQYSFTAFSGGELTGLARNLTSVPPWDAKFGHLNIFNLRNISNFTTNGFIYLKGTTAMDRLTEEDGAIGQFNHPGYNNEPRTGDDKTTLYPYTPARDQVFKFFEISDGQPENWSIGIAQYNICLQKGYHVSPVIGSDIHDTKKALLFHPSYPFKEARTVIIAPSTLNMTHENRRKLLLESIHKGLVYATESPNLHIKFSINGFLIGHRFNTIPDQLEVQIDVEDNRDTPLKSIELVQNQKCTVSDDDVNSEQQCTSLIKEWSTTSDPSSFQKNNTQFHTTYYVDPKKLISLKYIYLKVTQINNDHAMTTPFFFY